MTAIAVVVTAALLPACGGEAPSAPPESDPSASTEKETRSRREEPPRQKLAMSEAERAKLPKLVIPRVSGPAPSKLVVKDLRKGTGASITLDDAVVVKFYSVRYREALKKTWRGRGIGPTKFGLNEVVRGWVLGLPGMKVGGRRVLTVPSRLAYRGTNVIYVIDLLAIEPGGAGSV